MPIHIEANIGDVAQSVILVGDPDRATFIAENYLENPVCYNRYRHMYGYTGTYKGKKISVQTAGMGSPSISIVLEELNMPVICTSDKFAGQLKNRRFSGIYILTALLLPSGSSPRLFQPTRSPLL